MRGTTSRTSTYADKVIKGIPAEWVSAYVAIKGILDSTQNDVQRTFYAIILILLILLPCYLWYVRGVKSTRQISVTTISFLVWVFSLGGDHVGALSWYKPYQGSVLLILWTLAIPILIGGPIGAPRTAPGRTGGGGNQGTRVASRTVSCQDQAPRDRRPSLAGRGRDATGQDACPAEPGRAYESRGPGAGGPDPDEAGPGDTVRGPDR